MNSGPLAQGTTPHGNTKEGALSPERKLLASASLRLSLSGALSSAFNSLFLGPLSRQASAPSNMSDQPQSPVPSQPGQAGSPSPLRKRQSAAGLSSAERETETEADAGQRLITSVGRKRTKRSGSSDLRKTCSGSGSKTPDLVGVPAPPTPSPVAATGEDEEAVVRQLDEDFKDKDSRSRLSTIFSPMFSLFVTTNKADECDGVAVEGAMVQNAGSVVDTSSAVDKEENNDGDNRSRREQQLECDEGTTAVTDGNAGVIVDAGDQLELATTSSEEQELEDADVDDDAEDYFGEFDPYLFIRNLPPIETIELPRDPVHIGPRTRRTKKNTLVLDLDETLVHSTLESAENTDFSFPVYFNNMEQMVHVRQRPHLHEFMQKATSLFEVVIFTASAKVYAEKLLNVLDPNRSLIRYRVFRESCVFVDGNYLKDLRVLHRDLSKVAIIDNSPQAFGYQLENGIPIESWFDDVEDTALLDLLPFLEHLAQQEDVRPLIRETFRLHDKVAQAGRQMYNQ
mmetsp:Transcript_2890/g.10459  ORF Transcript_2890/g.10459 Transcript_2890/m.10459 type:complete len:512 (+) Transcript_2890:295-1830(+)